MIRFLRPLLVFLSFATLMLCCGGGVWAQGLPSMLAASAAQHKPAAPAPAAQSAPQISPQQAQQALDVLQSPAKRDQFIGVLQTIAKSEPASASKPAAPAPAAVAPAPDNAASLDPNSLGAELLVRLSVWMKSTSSDVSETVRTVTDFPLLWHWIRTELRNPEARLQFVEGVGRLLIVVLLSAAAEWMIGRTLLRPIAALQTIPAHWAGESEAAAAEEASAAASSSGDDAPVEMAPKLMRKRRRTWRLVRRIPRALGVFALDLLPLVVFLVIAYVAMGVVLNDDADQTRLATLTLVYAYVLCRVVLAVTRLMVSPPTKGLRLIRMSDQSAAYAEIWVRRIIVVAAFGMALADIAVVLGLYRSAHDALVKIVMLIVHLFVAIVILQCRHPVAHVIRADLHARGGFAMLRNRLGDLWHYLAIFFVLALWVVWAFSLRDGYARLVHFTFVTIGVLVAARLIAVALLGAFDKGFQVSAELSDRFPGLEMRANRYYPLLRSLVSIVLGLVTVMVLLQVWGIDAILWFMRGSIGGRLVSAGITIAVSAVVAVAVWEISNAVAERHLARLAQRQEFARSARLRTLLPMLRTALLIVVLTVLILTILSEIGVNIAPLLASAGIVGIAVGFGSQKLVQDLITGLFLLLEDAMQVGDTVTVASLSGVVEHLSIRTIRLRAGDGSVHIIPFSSVTTVTNVNRGVGNAAVSVNIAYSEDTDRVGEVMKAIAVEMRADDPFTDMMLSDLQLWGVDKVDAHVVTMVGQIVCKDTGRWGVQREYNRRLKRRFQEEGIEIANPTQTVVLKTVEEAGEGDAPVSPASENPANVTESPQPSALGHDH